MGANSLGVILLLAGAAVVVLMYAVIKLARRQRCACSWQVFRASLPTWHVFTTSSHIIPYYRSDRVHLLIQDTEFLNDTHPLTLDELSVQKASYETSEKADILVVAGGLGVTGKRETAGKDERVKLDREVGRLL